MRSAYRIKRYEHITPAKRRRLLEEKLVPILDDNRDKVNNIEDFLKEGDWLVEYRDSDRPIYLYKVKSYQHKLRLHLYVKHFIEAEIIYKLEGSYFSEDVQSILASTEHLGILPTHIFNLLEEYHEKAISDPYEKFKQVIFLLQHDRNNLNKIGKELLREVEKEQLAESVIRAKINNLSSKERNINREKKAPAQPVADLVDPTTVTAAIPKAALEAYMKNHNGHLPTVKELENLTKRFMNPGTRRRRRAHS